LTHLSPGPQGVRLDFLAIEAALGDRQRAIFSARRCGGPKCDGDSVEIARVVETGLAYEILIIAVLPRIFAHEPENRRERRVMQLPERRNIYICHARGAWRQFAHQTWRGSGIWFGRPLAPLVNEQGRRDCGNEHQHGHRDQHAFSRRHRHGRERNLFFAN